MRAAAQPQEEEALPRVVVVAEHHLEVRVAWPPAEDVSLHEASAPTDLEGALEGPVAGVLVVVPDQY
jgi:hypothetical protein